MTSTMRHCGCERRGWDSNPRLGLTPSAGFQTAWIRLNHANRGPSAPPATPPVRQPGSALARHAVWPVRQAAVACCASKATTSAATMTPSGSGGRLQPEAAPPPLRRTRARAIDLLIPWLRSGSKYPDRLLDSVSIGLGVDRPPAREPPQFPGRLPGSYPIVAASFLVGAPMRGRARCAPGEVAGGEAVWLGTFQWWIVHAADLLGDGTAGVEAARCGDLE